MIEIIALFFLTRKVGQMAELKGLSPGRWKLIMVLAWFGFEILGALVGMMISGELLMAALLGIGAAFGGYLLVRYRLEQYPDLPSDDFLQNLGR